MSIIFSGSTRGVWPPNIGPLTEIQPFTYEDALTYTDVLASIKHYIKFILEPYLKTVVGELNEINAEMIAAITEKLAEQTADVIAKLAEQDAENDQKIADLTTYVNEQVALIIGDSIEVQDPVVAGMVADDESQTRAALDSRYGDKAVTDSLNSTVTTGRLSETSLDAEYANRVAFEEAQRREEKYPILNATAETMRASNIRLGAALMGGEPFRILTVGDSTTQGPDVVATSYPTRLVNALKRKGIVAGFGIVAANPQTIQDTRWGVGPGWFVSQVVGPAGGTFVAQTSATGQLYIAPGEPYTAITIHYVRGTGGVSAFDRAGVPLGNIDTTQGTPNTYGSQRFVLSGDGEGSDDLFGISPPTGGAINILGFELENSAARKEVVVDNFGQNGTTTNQWVDTFLSLEAITYANPDITIVCLGINNSIVAGSADTYFNQMVNIIGVARAQGEVMVLGFPESNPTFRPGIGDLQNEYETRIKAYCKTNNIPYFDFNGRSGPYSDYTSNPWYRDEVHQSDQANVSIALAIADLLV